jgi:hypothetical protein
MAMASDDYDYYKVIDGALDKDMVVGEKRPMKMYGWEWLCDTFFLIGDESDLAANDKKQDRETYPDLYKKAMLMYYIARLHSWVFEQELRLSVLKVGGPSNIFKGEEIFRMKTDRVKEYFEWSDERCQREAQKLEEAISQNNELLEVMTKYNAAMKPHLEGENLHFKEPHEANTQVPSPKFKFTFDNVAKFLSELQQSGSPLDSGNLAFLRGIPTFTANCKREGQACRTC